jgi:hypothetical protein
VLQTVKAWWCESGDPQMPKSSFSFFAVMLLSVVVSFIGGIVFWRWFELKGTAHAIRDARFQATTGASNPSADEPLVTPQLLRAALGKACEDSESRDFYGPGVFNIPRSLWDEAIKPTAVLSDKPKKSAEELKNDENFRKEIEKHQKELEDVCRDRDRIGDTDLMLPLEWSCEEFTIPDKPSPESDKKFAEWEKFPAKHHLSEDRFSQFLVAFELAVEAEPEGQLRERGQCLRTSRLPGLPKPLTLHVMEADAAQGALCDARDATSRFGQNRQQFQDRLRQFAETNNVSTQRAHGIMEDAVREAKTKDPDVTWAEYCASTGYHNDDRSRLDLSVFERTR